MGNLDDEESLDGDASKLEQCLASKPMKILMFIIMVVWGLLCVIFDWLWLSDEMSMEQALVFGPADDGILITLFIIVVIGKYIDMHVCSYIFIYILRGEIIDPFLMLKVAIVGN